MRLLRMPAPASPMPHVRLLVDVLEICFLIRVSIVAYPEPQDILAAHTPNGLRISKRTAFEKASTCAAPYGIEWKGKESDTFCESGNTKELGGIYG